MGVASSFMSSITNPFASSKSSLAVPVNFLQHDRLPSPQRRHFSASNIFRSTSPPPPPTSHPEVVIESLTIAESNQGTLPVDLSELHDANGDSTSTIIIPSPAVVEVAPQSAVSYGKPFLLRWDPSAKELAQSRNRQSLRSKRLSNVLFNGANTALASGVPAKAFLTRKLSWFAKNSSSSKNDLEGPCVPEPSSEQGELAVTENSLQIELARNAASSASSTSTSTPSISSKFYWCADEVSRECTMSCVAQTSLVTFHARNANAVNFKGSTLPLVPVLNSTVVTIYANVGGGRYLSVNESYDELRFVASPPEVRSNAILAERCEFTVRRVGLAQSLSKEDDELMFGDLVTLECTALPGAFLCAEKDPDTGSMTLVVTPRESEASRFVIHFPTLRELVQLNATNSNSPFLSNSVVESNDFEMEEARAESERERQWMEAIAKNLPIDLAKRIFGFHREWVRTARLTCKSWRALAEKSIKRIRVNGEFCSVDSEEERDALVTFVRRCPSLEVLTIRNVIALTDDDIAKIADNKNLRALILGGCERLSDRSTIFIADKLTKLTHLNLATTSITDESLKIVAQKIRSLKELNLYKCRLITAEGVNRCASIESGMTALEHINLRGTVPELSLVAEFKRKKPQVVVLAGPPSSESIWG